MNISQALEAFSLGQLQGWLGIQEKIAAAGLDPGAVAEWVELQKKQATEHLRMPKPALTLCPACGAAPMRFWAVNTGPGDQTGDDSTFVWICPACGHEKWTDQPLEKIVPQSYSGGRRGRQRRKR